MAPPTEPTDEALMLAYARGEAAAFDTLYARHEEALYRFVRRLLGPAFAAQADEVFQDCWLRMVAARGRFTPQAGTRWRGWAFAIAHNAAMDRLRGSGRMVQADALACPLEEAAPHASLEALAEAHGPGAPSTEDAAHWRAAGRRLLHCLDRLPEAQRAAFLLHHEEGLTLDDMAAQLALGFETLKSRLRYAVAKLRDCMGAYLEPGDRA